MSRPVAPSTAPLVARHTSVALMEGVSWCKTQRSGRSVGQAAPPTHQHPPTWVNQATLVGDIFLGHLPPASTRASKAASSGGALTALPHSCSAGLTEFGLHALSASWCSETRGGLVQ